MPEESDTYEEPVNASSSDTEEQSEELYERLSLVVDGGQEPMRLDKFLTARMEGASRNKVQQAIESGRVLVNNNKAQANHKIKPGEEIVVFTDREPHGDEIIPEEMPLDIRYEDNDVMIVNKRVGMVVHPASGNYSGTLINGVAYYLLQQNSQLNQADLPRFGLVHRIDKNTSGLMVLTKNSKALASLAKQFFDHTVHRQYIALVWGDVEQDSGTIRANIGRHKRFRKLFTTYPEGDFGKEAVTHYKVLERLGYVTLIQCELETGRTHQIRVHMQSIGHPLFNDDLYGGDRIVKGTVFTKYKQFVDNAFAMCPRHALHAKTIGFIHPTTKEQVSFDSVVPDDMTNVIEKWRGYARNKNI
jgi:23S rRNA pseudouridine1911/1915/1917 synthase